MIQQHRPKNPGRSFAHQPTRSSNNRLQTDFGLDCGTSNPNPDLSQLCFGKILKSIDLGKHPWMKQNSSTSLKETNKQIWRNSSSSAPQVDTAQNWTIPWHHLVGGKERSVWLPSYPSFAGCCTANPFPSSNIQSTEAGPSWLSGGKKLGKRQVRISKSIIKGHSSSCLSSGCLEKVHPQTFGRTSAKDLPTSWQTPLTPQVLNPYFLSL